jgi:hypothetical protein
MKTMFGRGVEAGSRAALDRKSAANRVKWREVMVIQVKFNGVAGAKVAGN